MHWNQQGKRYTRKNRYQWSNRYYLKYVRLAYKTISESKVGVGKSFTENIRNYKFHNKDNSDYQITSSKKITDDIAEISKLAFNHKTKDIDITPISKESLIRSPKEECYVWDIKSI